MAVSQTPVSLTAPIDLPSGAMLLANMLIAMIEEDPTLMPWAEVSDEHEDHASAPEQAGLHLCATVDAGPSSPQSGEHGTPICAQGQGIGARLAAKVHSRAGSGPGDVRGTDGRTRGLQDPGGRCLDEPGRSSLCPGGVAPCALEPRLASTPGTMRPDAHLGHRRRWLLRPGGLQRRAAARSEGYDGPGRAAFSARAPPRG